MQTEPKTEQRQGGEENQDAVGQGCAAEPDHFEIHQQHQAGEDADDRPPQMREKQVLHQDQRNGKQRGRKPGRKFADAECVVGEAHQPVDEDGLGIARLVVEGGTDPVAGLQHLAAGLRVAPFIPVGQTHAAEVQEEEQAGQDEQEEEIASLA